MVLAILGCGFESGGIPGATGAASLGTADSDGTASTDDGPSEGTAAPSGTGSGSSDSAPDSDDDPDATAGDPTTATTDTPTSTSTTDDPATTGEPVPPTDTGSSTTTTGDEESSSDDGVIQDQPYYGDCTSDADCGDGDCAYFQLGNPDAAVCLLPCDQGLCPEPPDGQAEPICTTTDDCALDCGAALKGCPTGMSCYIFTTQLSSYARCLWPQD